MENERDILEYTESEVATAENHQSEDKDVRSIVKSAYFVRFKSLKDARVNAAIQYCKANGFPEEYAQFVKMKASPLDKLNFADAKELWKEWLKVVSKTSRYSSAIREFLKVLYTQVVYELATEELTEDGESISKEETE